MTADSPLVTDHIDALVHELSELLGKVRADEHQARGHRPMSSEGAGFSRWWVRVATDVFRSMAATHRAALVLLTDGVARSIPKEI